MPNNRKKSKKEEYRIILKNVETRKKIIDYYTQYTIEYVNTKYKDTNYDKNDLIQAGIEGLLNGIDNYIKNPSPYYFSQYIVAYIHSRILKTISILENKNKERIVEWVIEMSKGNMEYRNKIIEYYTRNIIRTVETKYSDVNCDKEELVQAGFVGLLTAINNYTLEHKLHFSSHVSQYISNYIDNEIKNSNIVINNTNNHIKTYSIEDIENLVSIKESLNKLPQRYIEILYLHIYENYTFEALANKYNISRQRAERIYKKAIKIIKEEITGEKQIKGKQKIVK